MTSPWLRSKPSDWRLGRLKDLVESCRNGTWGDEPQFDGDGVRTIRVADFDWAHLIVTHPVPTRRLVDRHQLERVGLANGDLILEKSGGGQNQPVGRAVRFQGDGQAVCSNFTARVRPSSAAEPRYLCYSFAAAYWAGINQRSIKQTTGIQNLDSRAYLAEAWAYPSVADQRKIADFLDRETARIDELVDKKIRLTSLLEEKRTALISRTVTRGFDASPTLSSSHVWPLDQLPTHWKAMRLRRVVHYLNSNVDKKTVEGEEPVRLCNYTDVYYGSYIDTTSGFMEATATAEEIRRFKLHKGEVLITKDSESADDIGLPAFVSVDLDALCGYHLAILRSDRNRILGEFLYWVLESKPLRAQFELKANGVTRFGLTREGIGSVILPVPPVEEQAAIASRLLIYHKAYVETRMKLERQVELLQEYRQALITASVTGAIDVAAQLSEPEAAIA